MSINEQNVCRASAKSVNKLIKSSNSTSLRLSLCRGASNNEHNQIKSPTPKTSQQHVDVGSSIKSLISCFNRHLTNMSKKSTPITHTIEQITSAADDSIDDGYYSIQTNGGSITSRNKNKFSTSSSLSSDSETNMIKSYSSLSSVASSLTNDMSTLDLDSMKYEIENFLNNMQSVIDVYVRPLAIFKILDIEQSLTLFQNIEKLVPVTRFVLNMINSYEQNPTKLPNVELVYKIKKFEYHQSFNLFILIVLIISLYLKLKVVFESFKTYLLGLPKATSLLGELAVTSDLFMDFLEVNISF